MCKEGRAQNREGRGVYIPFADKVRQFLGGGDVIS